MSNLLQSILQARALCHALQKNFLSSCMNIQELVLNYVNKVPATYQTTWLTSQCSVSLCMAATSFEGEGILLISVLKKIPELVSQEILQIWHLTTLVRIVQETSNTQRPGRGGVGWEKHFLFVLKVNFSSSFCVALVATMFLKNSKEHSHISILLRAKY